MLSDTTPFLVSAAVRHQRKTPPHGKGLSLAAAFAARRFTGDASCSGFYSPTQLREGSRECLITFPASGFDPVLHIADNIFHSSHCRLLPAKAAFMYSLLVGFILSYYVHG